MEMLLILTTLVGLLGPDPNWTLPPALDSLVRRYPADSLVAPLRRFESEHGRLGDGGEAALLLGRLHFARGEYRQAADALSRASARLDPSRKQEARYWSGLAWLAMREPHQARAVLEEVAQSGSPRQSDARFGVALAWELENRPDRAYEALEELLAGDPGEVGPAALARVIALSDRLHHPDVGRRAQARLLRDYPRSIEAAQVIAAQAEVPKPRSGSDVVVQLGVFSREARAQTLAASARRAGFTTAHVVTRGEGRNRSYAVQLGLYPNAAEARKAGDQAARKLGVAYRLMSQP